MIISIEFIENKKGGTRNRTMVNDQIFLTNQNKHSMQQTNRRTRSQEQEAVR
jgi:hypothetical protein